MDTAWIAPPAVLVGGAGVVAMLLRRLVQAVDDLDAARRRTRRLEDSLIPLRVETERARAILDRMRRR